MSTHDSAPTGRRTGSIMSRLLRITLTVVATDIVRVLAWLDGLLQGIASETRRKRKGRP